MAPKKSPGSGPPESPQLETSWQGPFRVSRDYIKRNPAADPSATELVINVLHTAELLGRQLDRALRPYGLTRGSHNVLQILGGAPEPLTPTQVSARLTVTSATVTGLLDTLESRGFARRRPHPADRRSILVEITEDGRQLLDDLVPGLIEHEKRWAAALTASRREQLLRLLGTMQDQLRSLHDASAPAALARR
jgi:DNA-binding MarR family transcriptional regulator